MTEAELQQTMAKLADAFARDDEEAGKAAVLAVVGVAIGSLLRIAAALEHIGRNFPAK